MKPQKLQNGHEGREHPAAGLAAARPAAGAVQALRCPAKRQAVNAVTSGDNFLEVVKPAPRALKQVTIIIPCYNEARGIGAVIDGVPHDRLKQAGYLADILVVDNGSTDGTAEVAREHGARVITEPRRGKGQAVRTAFHAIDSGTDYVVMIDGDDSYKTSEVLRLLEPLESGFCDAVMGSRLAGRMRENSMKASHRFGNWVFSALVRIFYQVNITDTLTGYFAWRYEVIERMRPYIHSQGFALEMEMITTMSRLGFEVYSVPITYDERAGHSSLRPFRDGRKILHMFARRLHWRPQEKLRVAFVSDAVYPFHKGGKEKHLHEVSRRLAELGREVHIYTMKWWEGARDIDIDGIHYHAISRLYPMYAGERRSIKQGLLFSMACLKMIGKPFDVVSVDNIPHFPLFAMRLICTLRRKRLYTTWHEVWGKDYWLEYLGGLRGYIGHLVEKASMKLPDTIISVSHHTTKRLHAAGVRQDIHTVLNGIDPELIFASPRHSDRYDVVYAGRLIKHKNVDMLIESIAMVKDVHPHVSCVIIGDGPERGALEQRTQVLGLEANVRFKDFVENQTDLYGYIKASKMLVLPSIREGFGLIVAEANACNIPVITTSHEDNGARELIIEGENGYLTQADAEELAGRILRILDEKGTLTPLVTFLREFGNLNWNRVGDDFDRILV